MKTAIVFILMAVLCCGCETRRATDTLIYKEEHTETKGSALSSASQHTEYLFRFKKCGVLSSHDRKKYVLADVDKTYDIEFWTDGTLLRIKEQEG